MSKQREPEEMICPAWMMTFGDCMSLLVTFFVMLIAFSSFEEEKLERLIGSLKGALGVAPPPEKIEVARKDYIPSEQIRGLFVEPRWLSADELSVVVPDLQMAMKRFGSPTVGADRYIAVTMLDEGVAFVISVNPLFAPGSSDLIPGNEDMLSEIGAFIQALANEARIIGVVHDATRVMSDTSRTPWGLAIERALAVQSGIIRECDLARDRFSVGVRVEDAPRSVEGDEGHLDTTALSWQRRVASGFRRWADDFTGERVEVIILGRRRFDEMSPEEIIVRDKWD